jgi:hypothetical protein
MENNELAAIMQRAGERLYSHKSSYAKFNAQENLAGRNYYATPETLRYFGARISYARETCSGLLFLVVDSSYTNYERTARGFRYAIFDIYGDEVARLDLDAAMKKSDQALKAAYKFIDGFDLTAHYVERIKNNAKRAQRKHFDALDLAAQIEGATLCAQ